MKTFESIPHTSQIAELKIIIIRQQELAAELFRNRQQSQARQARARLITLLNRLELLEDLYIPKAIPSSIESMTA